MTHMHTEIIYTGTPKHIFYINHTGYFSLSNLSFVPHFQILPNTFEKNMSIKNDIFKKKLLHLNFKCKAFLNQAIHNNSQCFEIRNIL